MSYAKMDHAKWLAGHLQITLSPFQEKVADILGMAFGGIYNMNFSKKKGFELFIGDRAIVLNVCCGGGWSTWDFDTLTKLVFLAHEARIRISLSPKGLGYMEVSLSERIDAGNVMQRHPNLDEAVASFRSWLPADHRIISREPTKNPEQKPSTIT